MLLGIKQARAYTYSKDCWDVCFYKPLQPDARWLRWITIIRNMLMVCMYVRIRICHSHRCYGHSSPAPRIFGLIMGIVARREGISAGHPNGGLVPHWPAGCPLSIHTLGLAAEEAVVGTGVAPHFSSSPDLPTVRGALQNPMRWGGTLFSPVWTTVRGSGIQCYSSSQQHQEGHGSAAGIPRLPLVPLERGSGLGFASSK